jgi:hypothetical protein
VLAAEVAGALVAERVAALHRAAREVAEKSVTFSVFCAQKSFFGFGRVWGRGGFATSF